MMKRLFALHTNLQYKLSRRWMTCDGVIHVAGPFFMAADEKVASVGQ